MFSYSGNVISAKARTMYGQCLKEKNYEELLLCHSVGEVAAYLKTRTCYAAALSDVNEATIHRGYLEFLLRQKRNRDYAALNRYDKTIGLPITTYLTEQEETEQLMRFLRLFSAGHAEEFLLRSPLSDSGKSRLDLKRLSQCRTYDQLLQELTGLPYRRILEARPPENGVLPLTRIENALYRRLTRTLLGIIESTRGELRRQLRELCGAQIDSQNVTRILRLKQFFGADPDTIRRELLPTVGGISGKMLEKMVEADTPEEVMRLFRYTPMGRTLPEEQYPFTYDLYLRVPYFSARHYIHFSSYPMVVLISFLVLTQVELDDITNIIEGIRYGLSPEQIRPMLVLTHQKGGD